MKKLVELRRGIIEEFRKPKYEGQYIIELKEIKQYPNEIDWDFDQIFNILMVRVNFEMSDIHHKEWFIAALLTHIRLPLMQKKIATQRKALEITMKLEASLVEENAVGMNQIQTQLENLKLQLQYIKKGKEKCEDLWCTRCHVDGHTKDTCQDL